MKILFLTDEFYPNFGANSLVIRSLAFEMLKRDIDVYVAPFGYNHSLPEEENYNGIKVVRIVPNDGKNEIIQNLRKRNILDCLKVVIKDVIAKYWRKGTLKSKQRIFARKVLRDFIIHKKIDVVVTINCSIELSFPVLWLKRHNQMSCKWFFYMIDPFETHTYYMEKYSQSILRRIQHKITTACDGIFTTDQVAEDIQKWENEEVIRKLTTLNFPKLIVPERKETKDNIELPNGKINIVSTGTREDVVRNPEFALSVCKGIRDDNVIFHFVGVNWANRDIIRKDNCVFYPPHSWEAVRNAQMDADALLNIGNIVSNQLPSKLVEYVSTGKPIINFYKVDECPSLSLLEGYPSLNINENKTPKAEAIEVLEQFVGALPKKMKQEIVFRKYQEHTPEFVTDRIVEKILKVIQGGVKDLSSHQ